MTTAGEIQAVQEASYYHDLADYDFDRIRCSNLTSAAVDSTFRRMQTRRRYAEKLVADARVVAQSTEIVPVPPWSDRAIDQTFGNMLEQVHANA